jgi:hypothetical protein
LNLKSYTARQIAALFSFAVKPEGLGEMSRGQRPRNDAHKFILGSMYLTQIGLGLSQSDRLESPCNRLREQAVRILSNNLYLERACAFAASNLHNPRNVFRTHTVQWARRNGRRYRWLIQSHSTP